MHGIDMGAVESAFELDVNPMSTESRDKINRAATQYRSATRSVLTDMGRGMLVGGVAAVVDVVSTEIINLLEVRSKQKKEWLSMRQRECVFVDSLQSVKGQTDFYGSQSKYGPLDPTDMKFDGFTLRAHRQGHEVLRVVCHIDTTRLSHMFLHSKFYLVADTIEFHPYRSFLPNLQRPRGEMSEDERDYWNTISQFSFAEYGNMNINVKIDVTSSWINELVQVFQDVQLGSFSINIPISENDLRDSVYVYTREQALARGQHPIDVTGDCFVVPRSYMPVSVNNPSWGTGEYRMKATISERCTYNPSSERSKHWHRDYKQLVRMQNGGKAQNDYWQSVVTTFRDNQSKILKATYTPALNQGVQLSGLGAASSAAAHQGAMGAAGAAAPAGAAGGQMPAGGGQMPAAPAQGPQH